MSHEIQTGLRKNGAGEITQIKVCCQHPFSPFPETSWASRQTIGGFLGWNPNGATVREIWDHLVAGRAIEAYTNKLPHHKGIGSPRAERDPKLIYIRPLAADDEGATIPQPHPTIVSYRGPKPATA